MKKIIFTLTTVSMIFSGIMLAACNTAVESSPFTNEALISHRDFYLGAESVGLTSSVRGTVFVKGDVAKPLDRRVIMTLWVELDPNDWCGAGVSIDKEWNIAGITSDFPQNKHNPEQYTSTWQNASDDIEYDTWVEIGREMYPDTIGGRQGNIIIELEPDPALKKLSGEIDFSVGIGSEDTYIMYPVSKVITVPLNPDPVSVVSVKAVGPTNPAGPSVEIVLKNTGTEAVVSLKAGLQLEGDKKFKYDFPAVSSDTPLQPGDTVSQTLNLIGPAGYSDESWYPLTIDMIFENDITLAYLKLVQIK